MARKLKSDDVLACLADLFARHGPPDNIRSDNGPEFTTQAVRDWLRRIGVKALLIERRGMKIRRIWAQVRGPSVRTETEFWRGRFSDANRSCRKNVRDGSYAPHCRPLKPCISQL